MTQENKQLLLKDLCARLPYDTYISIGIHKMSGIYYDTQILQPYIVDEIIDEDSWEYVKAYLRPMSSMTEEELKEFVQFHCVKLCPIVLNDSLTVENESKMMDWLIAHHFDFRDLIKKGLAIDCTNLNIY